MKNNKVEIWCLDIYVKFKRSVFCTLEFSSQESAFRRLNEISLSSEFITLEYLLLPKEEFRYAKIRKAR